MKTILAKSRAGYMVVIERTRTGYSAYVPDLPGCVTTGATIESVRRLMDETIFGHHRVMRAGGQRVPRPRSLAELRRKRLALGHTTRSIQQESAGKGLRSA